MCAVVCVCVCVWCHAESNCIMNAVSRAAAAWPMLQYKNVLRLVISNLPEHIPELLWFLCSNYCWNYIAGRLDFKTRIRWRFIRGGCQSLTLHCWQMVCPQLTWHSISSKPIHMKNVHNILISAYVKDWSQLITDYIKNEMRKFVHELSLQGLVFKKKLNNVIS